MNKKQIEIILKDGVDPNILTDEEKEIALIILKDLEGTLVIRTTSILNFCLKAIQYSKVTGLERKVDDFNKKEVAQEVQVQEQPMIVRSVCPKCKIATHTKILRICEECNRGFGSESNYCTNCGKLLTKLI